MDQVPVSRMISEIGRLALENALLRDQMASLRTASEAAVAQLQAQVAMLSSQGEEPAPAFREPVPMRKRVARKPWLSSD